MSSRTSKRQEFREFQKKKSEIRDKERLLIVAAIAKTIPKLPMWTAITLMVLSIIGYLTFGPGFSLSPIVVDLNANVDAKIDTNHTISLEFGYWDIFLIVVILLLTVYCISIKRLRTKDIKRMSKYVTLYETSKDPDRISSGLRSNGKHRRGD